ncbi:unnamed protein product [Candidula unifasciata]|uniref:Coiled-coil domain-containing protein n=1 Tax=Candidula unifasciata TaxID=100452 RepID=A0A8S4A1V7_9EUPU|nr:unnamed protein product [Candidula unifasciata]
MEYSCRPRPVTATVTKPRYSQPKQDDSQKLRRKSLESHGSTASLTSLLDHNSYNSASDFEEDESSKIFDTTFSFTETRKRHYPEGKADRGNMSPRLRKALSSDSSLSAWELWLIDKAKSELERKRAERLKRKQEQATKEKLEQEKRSRMLKGESLRSSWLQTKNEEMRLQKKLEKLRIEEEKRKKEEIEAQAKRKAAEKFDNWQKLKKEEEKERRRKIKEENKKKQQLEIQRKLAAEEKFQEWLKMAQSRPKTSPNSFGYLSGEVKAYYDQSACPEPSFYNPIPWQPISVPSKKSEEKKHKVKPYKWNPGKYL